MKARESVMSNDDVTYYRHRAEVETEMAAQATLPQAVAAHYKLANAYFDRIAPIDGEPDDHV